MMKSSASLLLASSAAALSLLAPPVHAQILVEAQAAEGGRLWFVELSGAPVADGNSLSTAQAEKAAFRRAAAAAGVRYTERRAFDKLFNGMSVLIDSRDRAKLTALPGVKAVWPVETVQAPPVEINGGGAAPDLASAIAMTGANIAQSSLGLSGTGVKVAVMDTGIDIDHPDFGGSGTNGTTPFANHPRIKYGYDFVGDAFNADPSNPATYNPNPVEDSNPDDCNGHGTHVAGIVGANGAVKGVAPGVTFGAYRVFGCSGSTTADIMIAAMERALEDGMHVLNMSIGSAFQWPQYPTARAADRLVNAGMVVVASIGNSGANGLYSASAPGLGQKVIGTASFDNITQTLPHFTVSPDATKIGYSTMTGSVAAPMSGSKPMSRTGTPTTANDACNPLPSGSLAGTAALIRRGSCGFAVKAANAQAAGAVAVIIYNNAAGRFNGTIAGSGVTIPTVQIADTEGVLLNGRIAAGATTMTWQATLHAFANPSGGLISGFSSYGLSPDLALKPDIGAPGGFIYSTYPLEIGGFASISGTSMASPHVAGASALMLEAKPNTPSQAMRTIFQNHADPKNWSLNAGLGLLDHVHRQGAGLIDIDDAILATTRVEPGKIATGEGEAGPTTHRLTIKNDSASAVAYALSSVNAVSTGGVITPTFAAGNASVAFSAASVTVPAGGSASVDATITPATAPVNGQYGGYLVLTDTANAAKVLRVPFAGFVGDYQAIQVLVPTANNFPWLAKTTDGTIFTNNPTGTPYSMLGLDVPQFAIHLEHQARRLRLEAFDAASGKSWHRIVDDEYVLRSATATGIYVWDWNGNTFSGKGKNGSQEYRVPNGRYLVKLSVLKALGDENNPAHWETWTSPVVNIARP